VDLICQHKQASSANCWSHLSFDSGQRTRPTATNWFPQYCERRQGVFSEFQSRWNCSVTAQGKLLSSLMLMKC